MYSFGKRANRLRRIDEILKRKVQAVHIYIFLIMLLLGLETGLCAKKNSDLFKCKESEI